jgi:hypothetical protein
MTLDFHCLFMSFEYNNVMNFATSGSKGSMSGKVVPYSRSHATKDLSIKSQLK